MVSIGGKRFECYSHNSASIVATLYWHSTLLCQEIESAYLGYYTSATKCFVYGYRQMHAITVVRRSTCKLPCTFYTYSIQT